MEKLKKILSNFSFRAKALSLAITLVFAVCLIGQTNLNAFTNNVMGYIPENDANYLVNECVDLVTVGNKKLIKLSNPVFNPGNFEIHAITQNVDLDLDVTQLYYLDSAYNYVADVSWDEVKSNNRVIDVEAEVDNAMYITGYIGYIEKNNFRLEESNVTSNIAFLPYDGTEMAFEEPMYLNSFYAPVENKNPKLYLNSDYLFSVEFLKSQFRCIDDIDGDITDRIEFDFDDYLASAYTLGESYIQATCEDNYHNSVAVVVDVFTKDCLKPVLVLDTLQIELTPSATIDKNVIYDHLSIYDNYNSQSELTITFPVDELSGNGLTEGVYDVQIKVADTSNNYSLANLEVTIEDSVPPVITGPKTLTYNQNNVKSKQAILDNFNIVDSVCGTDLTITLNTQYLQNQKVPGTYPSSIQASDRYGNTQTYNFTIEVIDVVKPVMYIGEIFCDFEYKKSSSFDIIFNFERLSKTDTLNILTAEEDMHLGRNVIDYEVNGVRKKININFVEGMYEEGEATVEAKIKGLVGRVFDWFR